MGVKDVSSDGRLLFTGLWPLVSVEREREREIILVNRIGLPQHAKGEYVTHRPIIILCKVWLKQFLGGEGGGGAARGRLPWRAGTVEWPGERLPKRGQNLLRNKGKSN